MPCAGRRRLWLLTLVAMYFAASAGGALFHDAHSHGCRGQCDLAGQRHSQRPACDHHHGHSHPAKHDHQHAGHDQHGGEQRSGGAPASPLRPLDGCAACRLLASPALATMWQPQFEPVATVQPLELAEFRLPELEWFGSFRSRAPPSVS